VTDLVAQLRPDAATLVVAVALDLILGDPVYPLHPVRIVGRSLQAIEDRLRALGADGYRGGILLFVMLAMIWTAALVAVVAFARELSPIIAWIARVFVVYSLLALGDLLHHVWRIESAVRRDDINGARTAVSALVGRDTDRMDGAACRRAAVESLSENLTDGFVSPICWYVVAGLPGLLLFKIVSTMDSMVGYKTPRYLQFGWCGARLDDVMNFLPARLTWLVIAAVAAILPACSGLKAWRIGLAQHAILLGPNSGWSEAATAGALQRRIVGPIWLNGALVTEQWIGDPADPALATSADVTRAMTLVTASALAVVALVVATLTYARVI